MAIKSKINILLLLLVIGPGVPLACGQTIFFFCVIDPVDQSIGSEVDQENMQRWVRDMAHYSEMDLEEKYLSLTKHGYRDLHQGISTLEPGAEDVILFYYSGHGSRICLERSSPPAFNMFPNYCVSQDYIHSQLIEKSPRMLITVFDCCVDRQMMDPFDRTGYASPGRPRADSVYKLFRSFRGDLRIQSNDPAYGDLSFGTPDFGGLFTSNFLDNFERAVRGSLGPVSWDRILRATYFDVQEEAALQNKTQVPVSHSTLRPKPDTLYHRD